MTGQTTDRTDGQQSEHDRRNNSKCNNRTDNVTGQDRETIAHNRQNMTG